MKGRAGVDAVERRVLRIIPARVVRGWVRLWAPLSRYGGRTRTGAAMMSRAMALLRIGIALDLANGHTLDSEFSQSGLHFLQLKWLDDCLDFFHVG